MNPWVWSGAQRASGEYVGVYKCKSDCPRSPAVTKVLLWKIWPWQMCFPIQRQGDICQKVTECRILWNMVWVGVVTLAGLAWLQGALSWHCWGFPTASLMQLHYKTARCMVLSPVGKDQELLWATFASYPGLSYRNNEWAHMNFHGLEIVEDEPGLWAFCHIYPAAKHTKMKFT